MLARLRKSKDNDEAGFTLIELLVVIIIIGILAAIAIPTFLNQRKKGWTAAIKSDVSSAQIAEETYATDNDGDYTTTPTYNKTDKVLVAATLIDTAVPSSGFQLVGTHTNLPGCTVTYLSTTGKSTVAGAC